MGPLTKKKSALERRLKDLERESGLVKGDIKALSKVLRNPADVEEVPRLRSAKPGNVPPPSRRDPVFHSRQPAPVEPPKLESTDLFEAAADQRDEAPRRPSRFFAQPPQEQSVPKNKAVTKDDRFANYFSSGNFLGARPLKQEKNVQRNRAIVMIVTVAILAFIVIQLWFK